MIKEIDIFARFISTTYSSCLFKTTLSLEMLTEKGFYVKRDGYHLMRIGYFGEDTILI